jgi:hypothetical protein
MCHVAVGELEQIQLLLRHASVQTTERYLACKQRLSEAVNDRIGLGCQSRSLKQLTVTGHEGCYRQLS